MDSTDPAALIVALSDEAVYELAEALESLKPHRAVYRNWVTVPASTSVQITDRSGFLTWATVQVAATPGPAELYDGPVAQGRLLWSAIADGYGVPVSATGPGVVFTNGLYAYSSLASASDYLIVAQWWEHCRCERHRDHRAG